MSFVKGPITFSLHTLDHKTILVFGEYHFRDSKQCWKQLQHRQNQPTRVHGSITDMVRAYAQEKYAIGENVDLYLESEYVPERDRRMTFSKKIFLDFVGDSPVSGLMQLRRHFDACAPKYTDRLRLLKKSYDCPPNLRVHLCDIRHAGYIDNNHKAFFIFWEYIAKPGLTRRSLRMLGSYLHRFLYEKNDPDYHKHAWKMIRTCFKIDRQLGEIKNPRQRQIVYNTIVGKMNDLLRALHQWYPYFIDRCVDKNSHVRQDQYTMNIDCSTVQNVLFDKYLDMVSCTMDMYLMARVLRDFKNGDDAPKNIMIYAGNYHAGNYRDVLNELGARCLFKSPPNLDAPRTQKEKLQFINYAQSCVQTTPIWGPPPQIQLRQLARDQKKTTDMQIPHGISMLGT